MIPGLKERIEADCTALRPFQSPLQVTVAR